MSSIVEAEAKAEAQAEAELAHSRTTLLTVRLENDN
jgi:hypothetical protein